MRWGGGGESILEKGKYKGELARGLDSFQGAQ